MTSRSSLREAPCAETEAINPLSSACTCPNTTCTAPTPARNTHPIVGDTDTKLLQSDNVTGHQMTCFEHLSDVSRSVGTKQPRTIINTQHQTRSKPTKKK